MGILAIAGQWILRLFSGWLPFSGEKLGKILWVAGIVIVCLFTYQKLTQNGNETKNNQKVGTGTISNVYNYYQPKVGFGCSSVPVRNYREKKVEL